MTPDARRASYRDLGVNSDGFGAEAVLYEDGRVEVRETEFEGEAPGGIELEQEQVLALVAWLANREEIADSGT